MLLLALASIALGALAVVTALVLALVCIAAAAQADRSARVPPLRRAVLLSDGSWLLSIADRRGTREVSAMLVASGLLGPLAALRWRDTDGQGIEVLLWPDSIPACAHRQLRVWLRSGRAHRETTQP